MRDHKAQTQSSEAYALRTYKALTLPEKVWHEHVVCKGNGEGANAQLNLLFIDLHLAHEVTSPRAIEVLRLAGRKLRRPALAIASEDHNTPALDIDKVRSPI